MEMKRNKKKVSGIDDYQLIVEQFIALLYAGNRSEGVWNLMSAGSRCFLMGWFYTVYALRLAPDPCPCPEKIISSMQNGPDDYWFKEVMKFIDEMATAVKKSWGEDFLERSTTTPVEFLDDGRIRVRVCRCKDPFGVIKLNQDNIYIYIVNDSPRGMLIDWWELSGLESD